MKKYVIVIILVFTFMLVLASCDDTGDASQVESVASEVTAGESTADESTTNESNADESNDDESNDDESSDVSDTSDARQPTPSDEYSGSYMKSNIFREDLPTNEDFDKISQGMTYGEVAEILKAPQYFLYSSKSEFKYYPCVYNGSEGRFLIVHFSSNPQYCKSPDECTVVSVEGGDLAARNNRFAEIFGVETDFYREDLKDSALFEEYLHKDLTVEEMVAVFGKPQAFSYTVLNKANNGKRGKSGPCMVYKTSDGEAYSFSDDGLLAPIMVNEAIT